MAKREAWWDDPAVVSWDWRSSPRLIDLRAALAPFGVGVEDVDTGCDTIAVRFTRLGDLPA